MRQPVILALWLIVGIALLAIFIAIFAVLGTVDNSDLPQVEITDDVALAAADKAAKFSDVSAQARASGQSRPVQITFSDAELTVLIGDWARGSEWWGSIDEVQLVFGRNRMVITGEISVGGLEADFRVDLQLVIEESERQVSVERMQAGDIHVPGFVSAAMLELAVRTVDAGLPRIPMRIESLMLGDGDLIVSGSVIP